MAKYRSPAGMIVRGWTVALDPAPEQAAVFRRDCGARRFAYNWAVAQIKRSFEAGRETGDYDRDVWSGWALRKRWNQVKGDVAPWWAECSKEAYAGGIAGAVTALKNWHGSRTGKRPGPTVQFPRFKKKAKDRLRCTYTTGALRVAGSRAVVLPGAGTVRTAENIRALWRHTRRGTGRVLSATVGEKAGRWVVSLRLEITARRRPPPRASTVGVDVGIGNHLLIVMHPDGSVAEKVPNPKALRVSLAELRRANRALARKKQGSPRWHEARRTLGRVHARAAAVRSDTVHKATARLTKTHGAVVIEDLPVRLLTRGLRRHRKAWADAAAGELRRQLTYKAAWHGCDLWVADRFYPSSKTCSVCGQVNTSLTLADRTWSCGCGAVHDRDENAGTNLARLPASQAEAPSDDKTAPVRHVAVKRVNHPGKVAA
ncbi:MAG: IS607 family element RNA-guided endonuclease TnpB [Streptosporangiaceae bacterium]